MNRCHWLSLTLAALVSAGAGAQAQEDAKTYPTKPVRLIVGFAAGGGNDLFARIVSQKMAEGLGQPVIVENKPGAGAVIATEFVAKSAPDGYTLLVGASGAMAINPSVMEKLSYDTLRDFAPISMLASFPLVLVASADSGVKSAKDLAAYIKANPRKANAAGSSVAFQLATELFKMRSGAAVDYVGYKSTGESVQAVAAGQVLMTIADPGPIVRLLPGGKLVALGVTSGKRWPDLPDVPTLAEAGVPGMEFHLFSGVFAPVKTPPAILAKLEAELRRVMALDDVRQRFRALAALPEGGSSTEFAQYIKDDIARWTAVARAANVKMTNQ